MADQFAAQFRRYWLVIVTVAGACSTIFGFQYAMMQQIFSVQKDLSNLNTAVTINIEQLKRFADQGPRYTLADHETYAKEQRMVDAEQNRRLTILENDGTRLKSSRQSSCSGLFIRNIASRCSSYEGAGNRPRPFP